MKTQKELIEKGCGRNVNRGMGKRYYSICGSFGIRSRKLILCPMCNAKLEGYNQALAEKGLIRIEDVIKFEKEKGSRCIEGSILFDISAWNKFKASICEEKKHENIM